MDQDRRPDTDDNAASLQRFRDSAQQGLLKHALPRELGGYGDRFCDLVVAHESMGRISKDSGLLLSINAHLWGTVFPMMNYGTPAQHESYFDRLLNGELLGGHAITEPHAGSDLSSLATLAEENDAGFLLNGHKRFITNTPIADLLIVYARLEKKLSAFIIHRADPGVQFCNSPQVTGCRSATMGDVVLEQCQVPHGRLLGKRGIGNTMIQQALELERAFIFAGISGVMEWQLERVIQFSRTRIAGQHHLGKNQSISHKIAEMKLRLDTLKLWINECARLKDANKRISLASAQTKLYGGEAFLQSSLDAVHILGASGLMVGNPLNAFVGDALASRLFSGSSEIQKNIIAALLGTGDGYTHRT